MIAVPAGLSSNVNGSRFDEELASLHLEKIVAESSLISIEDSPDSFQTDHRETCFSTSYGFPGRTRYTTSLRTPLMQHAAAFNAAKKAARARVWRMPA